MRTMQFLVVATVCSLAAHATEPPPVEAYGRLPAIGDVALSPDGKRLALSVGYEYRAAEPDREFSTFRILNIDTGAFEHTLASPKDNTLRGVGWADDRRSYYFISAAANARDATPSASPVMIRGHRYEFWRTGVFSLDKGAAIQLMQSASFRFVTAVTNLHVPIEGDPGFGRVVTLGVSGGGLSPAKQTLYRVNLDNGTSSLLTSGNAQTRGFMLNERGEIVARVDINDLSNRWRLFVYEDGKDRMILEDVSEMGIPLLLYGMLPDGRIVAVDPHEEGARDTLLAIDRRTGVATPLHDTDGSDVAPLNDSWTHRVVGATWIEDLPKQKFFDPQLQAIADAVQPHFAGGFALLESWSRDRARALVFGERVDDSGAYYIYDVPTKKLRAIGKRYPALTKPEHLGERRSIKYRARDGTSIPAYLTLPAGVEPKKLPLVLLVHGGPHARDTFTFDWWASFLASRGYAVLQANYRGSTGYGYDWFNAGRGGWGDGVMQTDVEDGADALAKSGYIDPARVCIIGGSYGGYAALAGATLTPQRYACAASINGLTDPERMLNASRSSDKGKRGMAAEWWDRSMGGSDIQHLRKTSPIENADKVRAPILILHGVDDMVVPIEQARSMVGRLRRADKNVRYVELKGDDHWLSAASTRTQMLRELETFLAENLGSKSDSTARQ